MGRRSVAGWRRGLKGDKLGRLLLSQHVGVIEPKEIIKIKWTEGSTPVGGRSRVAATARACDAILCLVMDSRKTSKGKGPCQMHQWLIDRKGKGLPSLYEEHEAKRKEPRALPDSLACMDDAVFDTWKLSDVELQAAHVDERSALAVERRVSA